MAEEIPDFAKKLSDSNRNLERAKRRLETASGNAERAKKAFENARSKLRSCEKKLKAEQTRVDQLERIHNALELAKETHLQKTLERGLLGLRPCADASMVSVLAFILQVPRLLTM